MSGAAAAVSHQEQGEPKYTEKDLVEIAESNNPIPAPDDLRESLAAFMSEVVVLLHTVKNEEMMAALKHLSSPVEQKDKPIRYFHDNASFILGIFGGHKAALVQTKKGADCRPQLMPALRYLANAKIIIILGFAYGRKSKCELGDVLVSTSIDGIGNIRLEHGRLKFDEGRVRQTSMSTRALNVFTNSVILWRKFICSKEGRKTKVFDGTLISSPVLLNDKAALDEYLKNDERFKGGEMEGQEVAHAQLTLKEEDKREIDFIVIKGVADFGDGSKAKGWQLTASLAAARYAEDKLRESGGNVYNCLKNVDSAVDVQTRHMINDLELQFNVLRKEILTELEEEGTNTASLLNDLEHLFRLLHKGILTELEHKPTIVSDILHSVTLLPIAIRPEYKLAINEILPVLQETTTIHELFYHINPMLDLLGYGLLQHIVNISESNTLQKMMNEYSEVVVQFMKKTTVKQLMDHWPGQQEIPPNFSKLLAKIDEDPTTYTLYQLDRLRKRYCCELKLTDLIFVMIGLDSANSFIIEWMVPSALVPQLMESAKRLDSGFYDRERILTVVVDEKQIFPDSKPKVPALKTTAVRTVTDVKETHSTVTQLSLSFEQLSLLPLSSLDLEHRDALRIGKKLSKSSSYSGVGIVFDDYPNIKVKKTLSKLNFKFISIDKRIRHVDLKTCLSNSAQFEAYPKTPSAAGSQPFVIAVFVTGVSGQSPGSLNTRRGPVDIVDDIIKPFLPKSAPHLAHIPKLFFISSLHYGHLINTQPPSFPDDDDANYCIAYHLAQREVNQQRWMDTITDLLCSGKAVQDVIEYLHYQLIKNKEVLYTFSCLKDKLILHTK